jgi:protein-disulfide isomerase/uncharacterized membrane protein
MLGSLLLALVPAAHAADGSVGMPQTLSIVAVVLGVLVVAALLFRSAVDGLLGGAVVGALASVYLTVDHFIVMHGGKSVCNVSSVVNCEAASLSKYAELNGIAISLYGLGFYAAMGYLAFRSKMGRSATAPTLLLLGALGAVGYDGFLAYKSATEIKALCIFCAGTWTINVLMLGAAAALVRRLQTSFVDALGKAVAEDAGPGLVLGLAVFILGVMVVRNQEGGGGLGGAATTTTPNAFSGLVERVRGRIVTDGTEPVHGDPAARFTLVEFADYQCPHCAAMAPVLKKFLEENKDVKLLFKNYPLDNGCNAHMGRAMHPWACGAAASAECARLQGKFWELSEAMFSNQEYLAPDDIKFMAERAGLDVPTFTDCVASTAAMDAVKADVEAGFAAEIDGTPSIFLLGAYGDSWVKLNIGPGDREKLAAFFAAARAGQALPVPAEPEPLPE